MILNEKDSRHEQVLLVAQEMMLAARTAPKAKGMDIIEVAYPCFLPIFHSHRV